MSEDKQEHVLCAANWYPDLVFPHAIDGLSPIYWLPQNIDRGIVFSGRHHTQCMYQCYQTFGLRQHELLEYQGFLTSDNRWVTRKEAREIAITAGQVDGSPEKDLFSEDIYYPYKKHNKREVPDRKEAW